MKTVLAYTSDKGGKVHLKKSQAVAADLEDLIEDITKNFVGDINERCDRFRDCRKGLLALLDSDISPRQLNRKYRRLWQLMRQYRQLKAEEIQEDIPF